MGPLSPGAMTTQAAMHTHSRSFRGPAETSPPSLPTMAFLPQRAGSSEEDRVLEDSETALQRILQENSFKELQRPFGPTADFTDANSEPQGIQSAVPKCGSAETGNSRLPSQPPFPLPAFPPPPGCSHPDLGIVLVRPTVPCVLSHLPPHPLCSALFAGADPEGPQQWAPCVLAPSQQGSRHQITRARRKVERSVNSCPSSLPTGEREPEYQPGLPLTEGSCSLHGFQEHPPLLSPSGLQQQPHPQGSLLSCPNRPWLFPVLPMMG